MKKTIVEKIIAKHAGLDDVNPGDIVDVKVDRLMINDSNGPTVFKNFQKLGVKEVQNKEGILVAVDHRVPHGRRCRPTTLISAVSSAGSTRWTASGRLAATGLDTR